MLTKLTNCFFLLAFATTKIKTDNRIVGGSTVDIEKIPYQLSLSFKGTPICGATLISKDTALSAAHCVVRKGSYSVRAGTNFRNHGGSVNYVKNAILHPAHNLQTNDYDIVILKLYKPFRLSSKIRPAKLPKTNSRLPPGATGLISGWGSVSGFSFSLPSKLRAVDVPIQSLYWCKFRYSWVNITPRMFCAGLKSGGRDACQGDSGGPLASNGTLYGIISWGFDCAQPGYPGVYADVASLRDYIRTNAGL